MFTEFRVALPFLEARSSNQKHKLAGAELLSEDEYLDYDVKNCEENLQIVPLLYKNHRKVRQDKKVFDTSRDHSSESNESDFSSCFHDKSAHSEVSIAVRSHETSQNESLDSQASFTENSFEQLDEAEEGIIEVSEKMKKVKKTEGLVFDKAPTCHYSILIIEND